MTDYLKLAVIFFAAVNPASVALAMASAAGQPAGERRAAAAVGIATAGALLVAAALAADGLLELLDVAPETFRIAAGMVMATVAARTLWSPGQGVGDVARGWQGGIFPLGLPLVAGPASVVAAMSYGVDEGTGLTLGAAAPTVVLGVALFLGVAGRDRPRNALRAVALLTAALLVVVAAGLIVSGVRDI